MMIVSFNDFHSSPSPWIENLPFTWDPIVNLGKKLTLKKHEYIFYQDQPAENIYIVVNGRIRLFLTSPTGDEKAIAIIGKNGLIGECGMFDRPFYCCSSITASKVTVIKVPVVAFQEVLRTDYHITKQVLYLMNMKNRILSSHTVQLSFYSAIQRICYTLFQLANTYGQKSSKKYLIDIRFTHQELANLVGTSRVTVANTMKNFEKKGIISKQNGKYLIEDMERLLNYIPYEIQS